MLFQCRANVLRTGDIAIFAILFQPVGVDEPGGVIVGVLDDGLKKCVAFALHGGLGSGMSAGATNKANPQQPSTQSNGWDNQRQRCYTAFRHIKEVDKVGSGYLRRKSGSG